jgi:sugar phosphate isomerase/epimerase
MSKAILFSVAMIFLLASCNNAATSTATAETTQDSTGGTAVNPATDWKFGIALWTFHTFSFPESLEKSDSAGVHYVEPNTFSKIGNAATDSLIFNLSMTGVSKLQSMAAAHNLAIESVYIAGDSTIASWVKQFEIAKHMGAKLVTTEPPLKMWDSIDSLAGVYGVKVAIHEHWKGVSHYWNPDTVLLALKGHPNFGVCADLGHWPKSGINPLDAVKKLSGHILVVHLKDIAAYNDPTLKDVPVGKGIVDFPAVFAELKKQGFKGYIYIERDAEDKPSNLPSVIETIKYYNAEIAKLK